MISMINLKSVDEYYDWLNANPLVDGYRILSDDPKTSHYYNIVIGDDLKDVECKIFEAIPQKKVRFTRVFAEIDWQDCGDPSLRYRCIKLLQMSPKFFRESKKIFTDLYGEV